MSDYVGVILAAGSATRILPLSDHIPKPLLPVGNKPIVQYQIEALRNLGVEDVFMVVGHLKEKIMTFFGDGQKFDIKITYIEQGKPLGIAHALSQLHTFIDKPFITFLGDILLDMDKLPEIVRLHKKFKSTAVLAVKREDDYSALQKNFAVLTDSNNKVKRVIEKPKRDYGSRLKGCGIYLFEPVIFEAAARTPRTAQRNEYELTDAIQLLIDWGESVHYSDIIEWDVNITYPRDLLESNLKYVKESGNNNMIHKSAKGISNCKVTNSIIGENVIIEKPISIKDSLILPNVIMRDERNILRSIVSPEATIFVDELE